MEYSFEIVKARIYVNKCAKTLAAIKKETGADVLINGGLYDMNYKDRPNLWLRVDGKTLSTDDDGYWCYGWDVSDFRMIHSRDIETVQNGICCCSLMKDGKKTILHYDDGQGGIRGRSAIGTLPDGRLIIYCTKDGTSGAKTPEQMQQYCLDHGWKDGIMLDSGGSSQCITPDGKITSTRKVHNVLCFWLKPKTTEGEEPMNGTEVITANDVLRIARKEVGTKEKPTNNVKYNTWYYGRAVSGNAYPWCMAFVQWVFNKAGYELGLKTASCSALEDYARKKGFLVKKNFRPGDIVFYQFDNDSPADHTGIVESVTSTTITCIEGNTSVSGSQSNGGQVCRKTRKLSLVRSAYRPNYGGYSLSDFIEDVQRITGSEVDGIAGKETLGNTVTISAVLNRKHPLVYHIQLRLKVLGYNVGTVDGIAGGKFTAAVKAFQKDNGCTVDGEVTARAKTWRKLLGMK